MEEPEQKISQEDQKTREKNAPESLPDDSTDKKYADEEIMKAVEAEWGNDDDEIIGDDVPPEIKQEQEKKKEQEKKEEKSEDIQQDEFAAFKEKPEPESLEPEQEEKEESAKEVKEPEKKEPLKLSEKAQRILSSYSGELSNQIEQLARANAELQAKLSSYGNVENTIKELQLENASSDKIIGTMKELKILYNDLQNPKFLDVVTAVASGDLSKVPGTEEKRVSDFMPEGERYDAEDAIDDPESPSWKARKKQEKHQRDQENVLNELLGSIRGRKDSLTDVEAKLAESKKVLNERLGEVKQFATDEYDVSESQFKDFVDSFKQFDTSIIKVAFAVFAKQKGISNKLARKLKENKDKVFPETKITESPEKELAGSFEIEDKQNKKYSKVFSDWEDDESVYK